MDIGIAQFWGGVAVVALASVVNIIITIYKVSTSSENIKNQMQANIDSVEKELKAKIGVEVLSKYRQQWINDLRKKVNKTYHLLNLTTIQLNNSIKSGEITKQLMEEMENNIYQVRKLNNYLELLLNPKEDSYSEIIDSIESIPNHLQNIFNTALSYSQKKISNKKAVDKMNIHIDKTNTLKETILKSTQTVLKEEWERVKKGV